MICDILCDLADHGNQLPLCSALTYANWKSCLYSQSQMLQSAVNETLN